MTIEVELTSHTRWGGQELYTFLCRYPRKIHAQVLTHRTFSRNSQSSRAMRIETMMEQVKGDPACIEMRKHGRGMQPSEVPPTEAESWKVKEAWVEYLEDTLTFVSTLNDLGWAKEETNRFLEPFAHITTIITVTREHLNAFFRLRRMEAGAQAAIDRLACLMRDVVERSEPRISRIHVPYPSIGWYTPSQIAQQLTAGARVSFGRDARELPAEDNAKLAERLWNANPRHASPMEHVVVMQPMLRNSHPCNFGHTGYLQMRHLPESWTLEEACQWVIEEQEFEVELTNQPLLDLGDTPWGHCRILNHEEHQMRMDVAYRRLEKRPREMTFTDNEMVGRRADGTFEWLTCSVYDRSPCMRDRPWAREGVYPVYPAQTLVHMVRYLSDEDFEAAKEWLRGLANAVLEPRDKASLMQQVAREQDLTMASTQLSHNTVGDPTRLAEIGMGAGGFWLKWKSREFIHLR
jgi:hypothetical protein